MTKKHNKMRKTRKHAGKGLAQYPQEATRAGLLVSDELEAAIKECKERVNSIAAACRARNRKFRDVDFDLERDRERCLHGLVQPSEVYEASDAQRVTDIFENPKFYINGTDPSDIVQGPLGDCWFLSALATMSTTEGLVEKFCVARNEQVGVYGFIFFHDAKWVVIIIDDFLYTTIPKFDVLSPEEQKLYHNSKETYNASARKHGKNLHFAKSGAKGETWVPLIEKAYAKLHGSYAALDGGDAGEAIEELTGGVTSLISTKDILSPDDFWNNELLHAQANKDRLFGCSFDTLKRYSSADRFPTNVNGLIAGHAYSVLRAVEHNGKRFVVLRNPWGDSEWTGRWSDGSKEWTKNWLPALEKLNHSFGNDGQFVMEYGDFLENWEMIDRTRLFDSSWIMSSQWLKVTPRRSLDSGYGDISFTISVRKTSPAVIVLSKLDERHCRTLVGHSSWSFDFVVFKKGETTPIAESSPSLARARSVNTEVKSLHAGTYVVHVRFDRHETQPERNSVKQANRSTSETIHGQAGPFSNRIASRMIAKRLKSQSIALNFDKSITSFYLSTPLHVLAGKDLSETDVYGELETETVGLSIDSINLGTEVDISGASSGASSSGFELNQAFSEDLIEEDAIVLGLRVYTQKDSRIEIDGQLRSSYC